MKKIIFILAAVLMSAVAASAASAQDVLGKWKLEDGPCEEKVIDEDLRQWAYDTYRTVDDHAMHIVGTATDDAGTKYYLIKNSWGTEPGYKGMYYISEAFMKYKTICLIINRGGMPEDVLSKLSE
jgi:bleomycin hydrolase